jgi:hypothetical protein
MIVALECFEPRVAENNRLGFDSVHCSYLIFAFHLALWHFLGRSGSGLQNKLKLKSLIGLRLLVPGFFYFWMVSPRSSIRG